MFYNPSPSVDLALEVSAVNFSEVRRTRALNFVQLYTL